MSQDITDKHTSAKIRVTIAGAIINVILSIAKVIVGMVSHSHALLIDGIHSLSDLAGDVLVVVVSRISSQKPDSKHPYGHQRFETLGTIILGSLLLTVAGAIIYDSILRFFSSAENIIPAWPALLVAALSILGKEVLYHYTVRVGKKCSSEIIIANAWHHRSDAFSSVVVLIGIFAAMMGVGWADQVAATVVSFFIAKIGLHLVLKNIAELVDTSPAAEIVEEIKLFISENSYVNDVHNLRCRNMGGDIFLDIHIEVDPQISVSEGHNIGDRITCDLFNNFNKIKDVTIHIDYEKDNDKDLSLPENIMPLRNEVIEHLQQLWCDILDFNVVNKLYLHYDKDKINIDLFLSDFVVEDNLSAQLENVSEKPEWLGKVDLYTAK
ncbi:MAG: cation transporter [Gammaproteobacteria bacterium]|nr:MAG: cation transporter [Gammaproteobacteria bacterium]